MHTIFYKVTEPFSVPTNNVLRFLFLQFLNNIFYFYFFVFLIVFIIVILTSVKWYLHRVWFAIPWWLLMLIYTPFHISIGLLSVFTEELSIHALPFFNWIIWRFAIELQKLNIDYLHLWNTWFANNFFQCLVVFALCWLFRLWCRFFQFSIILLIYFCFRCLCFGGYIQEIITKTNI